MRIKITAAHPLLGSTEMYFYPSKERYEGELNHHLADLLYMNYDNIQIEEEENS